MMNKLARVYRSGLFPRSFLSRRAFSTVERDSMDYDVLIVGGGPAGKKLIFESIQAFLLQ